jgi:dynein heavy chain
MAAAIAAAAEPRAETPLQGLEPAIQLMPASGEEKAAPDAELLNWVVERVLLPGFSREMWRAEHTAVAADFLQSPHVSKLTMFVDKNLGLCLNTLNVRPLESVRRLQYFLKSGENCVLTRDNIDRKVQYGVVSGQAMESLLKVMSNVFVPTFLSTESWPESVKKEFSGQMHKFMASLTETSNQAKGHTVLYIPDEDLHNLEAAAQDKDLVQRLESTVIHWTRQIKEVVSNQETSHHVDNSGPLEEIEFWRSRTMDLSGIREQLEREGVRRIVQVLELADSSYLKPFKVPRDMIQQGSIEAQNNLKFLVTLQEHCEKLAAAKPAEIPAVLPPILQRVRMISTLSKYYRSEERLAGLLRKVSNQIIIQCSKQIILRDIFEGDVQSSMQQLRLSIECGEQWKTIYQRTARMIAKSEPLERHWRFDPSSIFAQVDAFVQRCRDLLEVCEGQLQFARKAAGGAKAPLPPFGGSRGVEVEKSLLEIEEAFEKHVQRLRNLQYNILDVKATKWHDDYNIFKHAMHDLEVMMSNVISSAWEGVATVADGAELLRAFHSLAKRSAMRASVERKTAQIFVMFNEQLRAVRAEFDRRRKSPPVHPHHPRYAGAALWALGLLNRLRVNMRVLENAQSWMRATAEMEEARQSFAQVETVLEAYVRQNHAEWTESLKDKTQASMNESLEKPLLLLPLRPLRPPPPPPHRPPQAPSARRTWRARLPRTASSRAARRAHWSATLTAICCGSSTKCATGAKWAATAPSRTWRSTWLPSRRRCA